MSSLRGLLSLFVVAGLLMAEGVVSGQQMANWPWSKMPKEFIPRQVSVPYKDRNLCPLMQVPGLSYTLWTCGVPYVQPYCGVTSVNLYTCCPGFTKHRLINNKCGAPESNWKSLPNHFIEHSTKVIADLFFKTSGYSDFTNKQSKNVYTIFSPYSVGAIDDGFPMTTTNEKPHPILAGVVKNRYYSVDWKNGMTLDSVYKNQKLKITQYSNSLMFVECRALVTPDHEARNGIVHYISGPILPHVVSGDDRTTVYSALRSAASSFAAALPSDVVTMLSNTAATKWLTVFAPSNAAWSAVSRTYSGVELQQIAKNHILRKMICSGAITRRTRSLGKTLAGEKIGADCPTLTGGRFVLDACSKQIKISRADLMAGNGVVHVIDEVLLPLQVRNSADAVKCLGNSFDLIRTVKELESCSLNMKAGTKYIMLLPTNEAYKWFENYQRFRPQWERFQTDAEYRCNVYRYHVMELGDRYSELPASWWNQHYFKTNYVPGRDTWETNYFVKYRYGSELFFHYANVRYLEAKKFRDGYIYFVDRINVLPEKTVMQILEGREDLSYVYEQTKTTQVVNYFVQDPPRFLYIVPRNQGWSNRREKGYNNLDMKYLLSMHLVKLYLWGDDIGYFHRETYSTLESMLEIPDSDGYFQLRLKRNLDGNMFIGYDNLPMEDWAMVVEWNHYGFDGIIWIVDWPLKCPPNVCEKGRVIPELDTYTIYAAACIRNEDLTETKNEFSNKPLTISRKYPDSCVWFKVPTIEAYREWVFPKGAVVPAP